MNLLNISLLLKQTWPIRPPKGTDTTRPRPPNETYVYTLTAFVCVGAFLFGWDQGVMSMIIADQRWLDLMQPSSDWSVGFVISIYNIGCAFGALTVGHLADAFGRERTISFASVVFIAGALLQAVSNTISQISTGRFILGVGVGGYSAAVPLYISEISPATLRGRIGGIMLMILCFGEMIVFFVVYAFFFLSTKHWWRIPLAIQILPALVLAVGSWSWVPPSPRWLVAERRFDDAVEVLTRLHGSAVATQEIDEIREAVSAEEAADQARWGDMFRGAMLRVTSLGLTIQFLQQMTGTNAIFYYAPSLFKTAGLDAADANLATALVGVVLFITAWIPIFYFDRLGRRTWLQIGTAGMFIVLLAIAAFQRHALGHPGDPTNLVIVVLPYVFFTFFNASWSSGSWTYAAEIFPTNFRAKGNALCTASLWISNYIVAQMTPPISSAIGWGLYMVLAAWCVLAFFFVRYALVETRGKTLEQMAQLFGVEDDRGKNDNLSEGQALLHAPSTGEDGS